MPIIRDVRSVLFVTALLFVVTLVFVRGNALVAEHRAALQRAEATTRDMALLLEEYAKRTFETSDLVLADIARYAREKGGAEHLRGSLEAHEYLVALSRESSSGDYFLVVDRTGRPAALTAQHPAPDVRLGDQGWFRAHVAGAERVIGEAIVGRITGEILFTYTRRLADAAGVFDGAVQVAIRPTFLQEVTLAEGAAPEREIRLALWNTDGGLVARTGMTPAQVGQTIANSRLFRDYGQERSGTLRDISPVDGAEQIVSFRRLERWPLVVTASIPVASVLGPWWENFIWTALAFGGLFGALGWLVTTGSRLSQKERETQEALRRLNGELGDANRRLTKALDDKVALLQEVHHRVKNNLSVTSSLLSLQARRFTDPAVRAAFKDTQDRLRSVALIHEALYRTDASGSVRLDEYLQRLVGEVAAAYGAAERAVIVDVTADPIEVALDRAVPLALAVTEAVSNAFKHAFPEGNGGRITVTAQGGPDGFEVVVRDTGTGVPEGLPAPEQSGSLGQRLIAAFAAQINGTVSYQNDGGTVFRIAVPHRA